MPYIRGMPYYYTAELYMMNFVITCRLPMKTCNCQRRLCITRVNKSVKKMPKDEFFRPSIRRVCVEEVGRVYIFPCI